MIIITGPGRSGTSLIAQLYQTLGFDPGGEWVAAIHGGLELPDIVSVNDEILEALGVSPMGAPGGRRRRLRLAGKAVVPAGVRSPLRRALRRLPWMGMAQPTMLRWERYDSVARRFGARLRALAARHAVAKDPRFFWTLPLWASAGVSIDHVLIALRNLDATVESRGRMDSLRFFGDAGARNSIVYGLGLTMLAIEEHRIPYSIVRFPDFVERPRELFEAARFPEAVTEARFMAAFQEIVRPELVHDNR